MTVVEADPGKKWWKVRNSANTQGFVPASFLQVKSGSGTTSPGASESSSSKERGKAQPPTRPSWDLSTVTPSLLATSVVPITSGTTPTKAASVPVVPKSVPNALTTPIVRGSSIAVTTAKPRRGVAMYSYTPTGSDELALRPGDNVVILDRTDTGWFRGCTTQGGSGGLFPASYVREINDGDELQRVVAKFDLTEPNTDELAFLTGQQFDILRQLDDEWYLVRRVGNDGVRFLSWRSSI